MAQGPSGKRLNHQRRIPRSALEQATSRLLEAEQSLGSCKSFGELHELVQRTIGTIPKIGELTVYDTALRLGAFLGLEPEVVFLHAGTRIGASHLGIDGKRRTVTVDELPEPLTSLRPREIEDCLCIFKDALAGISSPAAA